VNKSDPHHDEAVALATARAARAQAETRLSEARRRIAHLDSEIGTTRRDIQVWNKAGLPTFLKIL
jgi:hypothetical protein